MKNLLKLILLVSPLAGMAQITITQSDFPAINERWVQFDDPNGGQTISTGGANMTWNYASSFAVIDTQIIHFQSPSVVPSSWSSYFPNATAVNYYQMNSYATFYKGNSTGFYIDGDYNGSVSFPGYTINSSDPLYWPVPFTYNSSRQNAVKEIDYRSLSTVNYKYVITGQQQFTADAYGNLTTPAGNFPNTLRLKELDIKTDSSFIDTTGGTNFVFQNVTGPDSGVTYNWFKNGAGTIVMFLDPLDSNPTLAAYGGYFDDNSHVGITENNAPAASVVAYPNPATTGFVNFNIANSESETITIFNSLGVIIKKVPVEGANKLRFSTDYFTGGAYLFTVCDKYGTVIQSDRFLIIK